MNYKPDWEQAKERILAWWEGEVIDRVCLQVTAPRSLPGDDFPPPVPVDLDTYWRDVDAVVRRSADAIRRTFWGGEAFPLFRPNLGPDAFAAFFGAPLMFVDRHTSWVPPVIEDWEAWRELRIADDNPWWQLQLELVRRGQAEGGGKWLTGIPDTHANADALAALRGRNHLCLDLYDHAAKVRRAIEQMVSEVLRVYDVYFGMVEAERLGSSSCWLPAWCPGRANVVQCDYLALISPQMAESFFMEGIVAEIKAFDRSVFHLDGPDAVRHLDALLAIPELDAIQWVPGAGALPMTRWIPLLQRIQAAGKSLHLSVWPHEVRTLVEALRPEGLMLSTRAGSESEVQDLLEKVLGWTA